MKEYNVIVLQIDNVKRLFKCFGDDTEKGKQKVKKLFLKKEK
jgi:hypothetical protein